MFVTGLQQLKCLKDLISHLILCHMTTVKQTYALSQPFIKGKKSDNSTSAVARLVQVTRRCCVRQLGDPAGVAQLHRAHRHAHQLEHVVKQREAPPGLRNEPLRACACA